jgi:hypothetical protein
LEAVGRCVGLGLWEGGGRCGEVCGRG